MDLELKKNELHYYTALIRNRKQSESGNALRNVIQTMAVSRNGYVCGEDFSNLDFGNVPLNNIHFSVAGKFPCTFMQSEVTSMNFINGHAGDDIVHAEFSDDSKYLITWGDDGKIIVWDFWGCTICQSFQVEDDFGKALSYSLPNYIKISAAKRFSNKEIEKWIYESIIPQELKSAIEEEGFLYEVCTFNESPSFAVFRYFTKDNKYIFGDLLIDLKNEDTIICSDRNHVTLGGYGESCRVISISPDENYFFIFDSEGGSVISAVDHREIFRLTQCLYPINSLAISCDDSALYSYSLYNRGIIWDLINKQIIRKNLSHNEFWTDYWKKQNHSLQSKKIQLRGEMIARFEKKFKNTILSKYHKCGNYGMWTDSILYISHSVKDNLYSLVSLNLSTQKLQIKTLYGLSGIDIEDAEFTSDASLVYIGTSVGKILIVRTADCKILGTLYHTESVHVKSCIFTKRDLNGECLFLLKQNGADIRD